MKKIIIFTGLLFAICFHAQTQYRLIVSPNGGFCGFDVNTGFYKINRTQEYITSQATLGDNSGIADVVKRIQDILNIDVHIQVFLSTGENNCFATIGENGIRIIIADQLFLNNVNTRSGTKWAAVSIIAHEVGHHIAGFGKFSSQHQSELAADYWSGYILKKLGASKEASTQCILVHGSETNTPSHPNKYSRAESISKGWTDASQ